MDAAEREYYLDYDRYDPTRMKPWTGYIVFKSYGYLYGVPKSIYLEEKEAQANARERNSKWVNEDGILVRCQYRVCTVPLVMAESILLPYVGPPDRPEGAR